KAKSSPRPAKPPMFLYSLAYRVRRLGLRLRGLLSRSYCLALGAKCGKGLLVDRGVLLNYPAPAGLVIGNGVSLGRNVVLDVPADGRLTLGDGVVLTMNIVIAASNAITIGHRTQIGENTSIRDSDHGMVKGMPMQSQLQIS